MSWTWEAQNETKKKGWEAISLEAKQWEFFKQQFIASVHRRNKLYA